MIGKLTLPLMSSPPVEPHSRATAAAAVSILPSLGCVALKFFLSLQWRCVALKSSLSLQWLPHLKLFRALLWVILLYTAIGDKSVYLEGRLVPSQCGQIGTCQIRNCHGTAEGRTTNFQSHFNTLAMASTIVGQLCNH